MQKKDNQKLKELIISFVLILIPLAIGLCIYILFEPRSELRRLFCTVFPNIDLTVSPKLLYNKYILFSRYYMCDALWAFSLESCIMLILKGCKKQLLISIIISVLFSVLIESLQGFNVLPGLFDYRDIAAEIIAVIIAGTINYFLLGRKTNENE